VEDFASFQDTTVRILWKFKISTASTTIQISLKRIFHCFKASFIRITLLFSEDDDNDLVVVLLVVEAKFFKLCFEKKITKQTIDWCVVREHLYCAQGIEATISRGRNKANESQDGMCDHQDDKVKEAGKKFQRQFFLSFDLFFIAKTGRPHTHSFLPFHFNMTEV